MSYTIKLDKQCLQAFIQSPLYNKEIDYPTLLFNAIEAEDYDTISLLASLTECFDRKDESPLHKICKDDHVYTS